LTYPRWLSVSSTPSGIDWLGRTELTAAAGMATAKRRNDYLLRRWAGKALAGAVVGTSRVEVCNEPGGRPFLARRGRRQPWALSLSDSMGLAVAAAVPMPARLGIDIEWVEPRSDAFITDFFTAAEARVARAARQRDLAANLIWSAKESALKALGTGLRADTRSIQVTFARDSLLAEAPGADWARIRVVTAEGKSLHGWWRMHLGAVLTVVADPLVEMPRWCVGDAQIV